MIPRITIIFHMNYKGDLLELCRKNSYSPPIYSITRHGADHEPTFECTLTMSNPSIITISDHCKTKKKSEQDASAKALELLNVQQQSSSTVQQQSSVVQPGNSPIGQPLPKDVEVVIFLIDLDHLHNIAAMDWPSIIDNSQSIFGIVVNAIGFMAKAMTISKNNLPCTVPASILAPDAADHEMTFHAGTICVKLFDHYQSLEAIVKKVRFYVVSRDKFATCLVSIINSYFSSSGDICKHLISKEDIEGVLSGFTQHDQ